MKLTMKHTDRARRAVVRLRGATASAAALALLSACTILPKAEPLDVYLLPAEQASAQGTGARADAASMPVSLRIARPAAGVHLAGQRIVVLPEDNRVSIYKGAGWSDPAPILVRNRLLDAFRADGRIAALSTDERRLHADFEIDSDLRAFQSEYRDGRPEVVVRLDVRLYRPDTQRIVASQRFEFRQAATDTAVPAVVQAFGQASDALALAVVEWAVAAMR